MAMTSWRKNNDPNYLGEWDIEEKSELKLTIKNVKGEELTLPGGFKEKRNVLYFKEDYHPMVVNSTNAKMLEKMTGSKYIENWSNTQIAVYFDPTIKFGKEVVGGLRIRLPKLDTFTCSDCGKTIKSESGMTAKVIANKSKTTYGAFLCLSCARIRRDKAKLDENKTEDVL